MHPRPHENSRSATRTRIVYFRRARGVARILLLGLLGAAPLLTPAFALQHAFDHVDAHRANAADASSAPSDAPDEGDAHRCAICHSLTTQRGALHASSAQASGLPLFEGSLLAPPVISLAIGLDPLACESPRAPPIG